MNTLKIGTFVKSKKGRDVNNVYIVKNINNKYVELVDGKGKTLENAKIKNLKHLEILEKHSEK
ncbi:MAG: KOW domain-containing protein, partial [Clostridia bacterium]|nr:KOW domain-containing protein [Clostridia bacterium]